MILSGATMIFYALAATGELEVTVGKEFGSLWMCELDAESRRRGGYHPGQLIDCMHEWVPSLTLPGTAAPEGEPNFDRATLVMRYTLHNGRPSEMVWAYESMFACHEGAVRFARIVEDRQGKVQRYDCMPIFRTDILLTP